MKDTTKGIALLALTLLVVYPLSFGMPSLITRACLGAILVTLFMYGVFLLKEEKGDERDESHKTYASRVALFATTIILLIGIVFQSLHNMVDPWLPLAIAGAIISKTIARYYKEVTN